MSSITVNQSSSEGSSTPVVTETRENDIINALSGVAAGLANQMVGWANNVFAHTSEITDAAVGNFFDVSQKMMGLSNNLTDQYNNVFAPQNRSLAREADSYNSAARRAVNMGAAGATQAQAGEAGLRNSEEALRSYGIDPSSGRYAALDKAAAVQNAANIAGAENMQRDRDIQTGQRLRSEAVQVGATLPAAIANVNNTAIQANTGATNAVLANANTGRSLYGLPNDYLKTAMEVKMPLQGQNTKNGSQSTGNSMSSDGAGGANSAKASFPDASKGGGGAGAGGAGSGGGRSGGPGWMPQHGGGGGSLSGVPDNYGFTDHTSGMSSDMFQWPGNDNIYQPDPNGAMASIGQPGSASDNMWDGSWDSFNNNNPFDNQGFGQTYDQGIGADNSWNDMGGGTNTEWGNISYDPGANDMGQASDWANTYDTPQNTDWGGGGGNSGYTDYSQGSAGGGYDAYTSENYYAKGGPIPMSASPSQGMQVDDVQAQGPGGRPLQMNAGEFVVPEDVARFKGEEFFQKLIEQSRKSRMTAPAHPTQTRPMR